MCGYREGDIYWCNIVCKHLQDNKVKGEFPAQCCCECGLIKVCKHKCDMNGNHNRKQDKV